MDRATLRAEIDQILDSFSEDELKKTKAFIEKKAHANQKVDLTSHFKKIVSEDEEVLKKLAQ